jgi:hypothetical protein
VSKQAESRLIYVQQHSDLVEQVTVWSSREEAQKYADGHRRLFAYDAKHNGGKPRSVRVVPRDIRVANCSLAVYCVVIGRADTLGGAK